MPNYRRSQMAGATYFFTVVTARRRPILASSTSVAGLRASVVEVRQSLPFLIEAWVVLPDHMHAIWTLPPGDMDFSKRWGRIKVEFVRRVGITHRSGQHRAAGIWQPRFWEHRIRGERDLSAHMDYLHYNPVKHGLVSRVADWPYSSFHRCVERGLYSADWGSADPVALMIDVGE